MITKATVTKITNINRSLEPIVAYSSIVKANDSEFEANDPPM